MKTGLPRRYESLRSTDLRDLFWRTSGLWLFLVLLVHELPAWPPAMERVGESGRAGFGIAGCGVVVWNGGIDAIGKLGYWVWRRTSNQLRKQMGCCRHGGLQRCICVGPCWETAIGCANRAGLSWHRDIFHPEHYDVIYRGPSTGSASASIHLRTRRYWRLHGLMAGRNARPTRKSS